MSDNFDLSPKNISIILRECRKAGVSELRVGSLHVVFGGHTDNKKFNPTKSDKVVSEKQKEIEKKAILADEIELREQQIADMFTEDPLQAEEMIAAGELKDLGEDDRD
jgi:hypothetical protein